MIESEVFSRDDVFGTVMVTLLVSSYGAECLNWEPETLDLQIRNDFGVDMENRDADRLNAAVSVLTTDLFFLSLEGFCNVCNSLNFGYRIIDHFFH